MSGNRLALVFIELPKLCDAMSNFKNGFLSGVVWCGTYVVMVRTEYEIKKERLKNRY